MRLSLPAMFMNAGTKGSSRKGKGKYDDDDVGKGVVMC